MKSIRARQDIQPWFVLTESARHALDFVTAAIADRQFLALAIVGPAGLGKSTLLHHIAREADRLGHLVILANAEEVHGVDDLIGAIGHSMVEELRRLLEERHDDEKRESLPLLTELVERRLDPVEGLLRILRQIDVELPPDVAVVLALDGIDNNRVANARAFSYFLRKLPELNISRLKLVVTARSLSDIERSISRLFKVTKLAPLTQEEATRLVIQRLHSLSDQSLPTEIVHGLVEISGGNPVFLTILAANALETGTGGTPVDLKSAIERFVQSITRRYSGSALKVVQLISIFNGEEAEFIRELTGLEQESFSDILENLVSSSLLRQQVDQGKATLSCHILVRDYVVRNLLEQVSLNHSTLQFGSEEAEKDKKLPDQLIQSPWLRPLLKGDKSIVLGDRGSGKSAIFRLFTENMDLGSLGRPSQQMVVVADNNPSAFVQRLTAHDGSPPSADKFKAIWLSLAAALVAKYLISAATIDDTELLRQSKLIVKAAGISNQSDVRRGRIRGLLDRLKPLLKTKVSFKLGPIAIEPVAGSVGSWFENSSIDVEDFLLRADRALAKSGHTVRALIDRIDEVYKYELTSQESLMQGLFLAEARLSMLQQIGFILLLRTDLFERYDIQEKNKFQSRTIWLNWSENDIVSMLLRRVFTNESLHGLVERLGISPQRPGAHQEAALRLLFPEQVEGKQVSDWLSDFLTNGRNRIAPRQVILLLNAAKEILTRANRDAEIPVFGPAEISEAMTKLSELSYDEVISDFRVATALVRNCRAGRITRFRLEEVATLIDQAEGTISLQVELLERLGFIRRVVEPSDDGELSTFFEIPNLYTRCWLFKAAVA